MQLTERPRFHLAFPVRSLDEARRFYGGFLGCPEGRSSVTWVDFDFYGHQIVAHLAPEDTEPAATHDVDGKQIPVRHFGLILPASAFAALADKVVRQRDELERIGARIAIEPQLRFRGLPGEQHTLFLLDPSGNAIELKAFQDEASIFAR